MSTLDLSKIKQVPLSEGQYVNKETKKLQIVLHHTAGNSSAPGTIKMWDRDDRGRIATCVVISGKGLSKDTFDGEICQAFSSKYWAYHLGIKGDVFRANGVPAKNLDKMSPSKAGLLYRQILGKMVDENIINSDQYIEAAAQSERVENQLNEMGVKTARDLKPSTSLQVPSSSQTNLAPINTQVTQPRANLFTTQQPTMPPAPMPSPMAASTDRSQQYAGLFPFDITGQQIARQG